MLFRSNPIPGATASTITIPNVQTANAGIYTVTVHNAAGTANTSAQLTVYQPLVFTPITAIPTTAESTPAILPAPSQLKVYNNGSFVTVTSLDPTKPTVVLTHGADASPGGWPITMANLIHQQTASIAPNIVAWDWNGAAITFCDFAATARRTQDQGKAFGQELSAKLGNGYNQSIHFIGHSFGTLVNAAAANYLHANGFSWTRTQMTLFDEAEVGTGLGCSKLVALRSAPNGLAQPLSPFPPLPDQFGWADNYVSLVGFPHTNAANVILNNGLPTSAPSFSSFISALINFHGYPCVWYDNTVSTPSISTMGYRWAIEQGGFGGAPAAGTVSIQSGAEFNLAPILYSDAVALLDARLKKYQTAESSLEAQALDRAIIAAQALKNGAVAGLSLTVGQTIGFNLMMLVLTSGSAAPQSPSPYGLTPGGSGNTPAYAWIPLSVASNTVSMSFDFTLQGNWAGDSFAAALNGTNVLSVSTDSIKTNVTVNTGLIDVSAYAGQQVTLFLGIVGGTSTNANITTTNFQFYAISPPSLQAQVSGNNIFISWPLSAADYTLETSTNLTATNSSWTAITNTPAIVELQNAITNGISTGSRFYRLRK